MPKKVLTQRKYDALTKQLYTAHAEYDKTLKIALKVSRDIQFHAYWKVDLEGMILRSWSRDIGRRQAIRVGLSKGDTFSTVIYQLPFDGVIDRNICRHLKQEYPRYFASIGGNMSLSKANHVLMLGKLRSFVLK